MTTLLKRQREDKRRQKQEEKRQRRFERKLRQEEPDSTKALAQSEMDCKDLMASDAEEN